MIWLTGAFLASYLGICEYRSPNPWVNCEARWQFAAGVMVPSPAVALSHQLKAWKREEGASEGMPPSDPPATGDK